MREILFRGKRVDNGEWVYGDLLRAKGYVNRIEYTVIFTDPEEFPKGEYFGAVHILPETVGQYTGMTDKNGKRIFEGDILQIKGYREVIDRCVVGCGIYAPFNHSSKSVGFYLCWKHDKEQLQKYANLAYWVEEREAVCIGNIHDNPELIAEV